MAERLLVYGDANLKTLLCEDCVIRQIYYFTCIDDYTYNVCSTLSLKPLYNVTKRQHKYTCIAKEREKGHN